MNKEEFLTKYPKGLNGTIVSFLKAYFEVMSTDEIGRCIESTKGAEKKHLQRLKNNFDEAIKSNRIKGWEDLNLWQVIDKIDSKLLMCEIFTFMVSGDTRVYIPEE